jgi:hypothetical protein
LIPAQFVKPFLKSNKNDFLDAEAIAEAVQRPSMRFVPLKTEDQLDLQALHRVRDRLVSRRTSVINQIRAFLLERGITFRQGRLYLRKNMPAILEDAEVTLSPRMRDILHDLWREWISVEAQIDHASNEIENIAKQDPACRRLLEVPGVGSLVATAMVAAVGKAWLLNSTPQAARQSCSGSASAAISICDDSSFMVLARCWLMSIARLTLSETGSRVWKTGCTSMSLRSPLPISWPASPGLFCVRGKPTCAPSGTRMAMERRLAAAKLEQR